MKPFDIFTPVQPGLEKVTEQILHHFNISQYKIVKGGFEFSGHWNLIFKLNCYVKTLSRVYIRFAQFKVLHFNELRNTIRQIDFSEILQVPRVCLKVNSYRSKLYHENAIRDIFFEELKKQSGNENLELCGTTDNPDTQLILINNEENLITISFDTSGLHLHKRGYLTLRGEAPLRETIASAMYYSINPDTYDIVYDPFCGSGTIPLEFLANHCEYSLDYFRTFSFMKWKSFDPEYWKKFSNNILKTKVPHIKAWGSDILNKNIEISQKNAQSALLDQYVTFTKQDIFNLDIEKLLHQRLIIVCNPPWGKRLNSVNIKNYYHKLEEIAHYNIPVYCLIPQNYIRLFKARPVVLFDVRITEERLSFIKV